MKALLGHLQRPARIGFVMAAWVLVVMVFAQVFHAGVAVLVRPGDWSAHTRLGHLFSIPITAMLLLSLIGAMGARFPLLSLGLYVLYSLQYLFLHVVGSVGLPSLSALHAVNALVILLTALYVARSAWRLVAPGAEALRGMH